MKRAIFAIFLTSLGCWPTFGQAAPDTQNVIKNAVRDIRDVQPGMSLDHVISGLINQYDCIKMETHVDGVARYSIWPKLDATKSGQHQAASIVFSQGKVVNVSIDVYPSTGGDAAKFAELLFWLLYNGANPMPSSGRVDKLGNPRSITLSIELRDLHDAEGEDSDVMFTVDGKNYGIRISKQDGHPDTVQITQVVSTVPEKN